MHEVSLKRLNYHFEESAVPKTTVVKFYILMEMPLFMRGICQKKIQ